jgi:hypothetical protein
MATEVTRYHLALALAKARAFAEQNPFSARQRPTPKRVWAWQVVPVQAPADQAWSETRRFVRTG